jgi:phage tail-like protein
MTIDGRPRTYHNKHEFLVAIDGFSYAGFQKCSQIKAMIAVIEHWEGGAQIADKSPGRTTFEPITLERGSTGDLEMFDWFEQTSNAAANAGSVDPLFRRNGDILQLDRDGEPILRWPLVSAWPNEFVGGDWDNTVDEKVITSITIVFSYMERPQVLR